MAENSDFNAILKHRKSCLSYLKTYLNVIEKGDRNGYLVVYVKGNKVVGSARLDITGLIGTITRVVTDQKYRHSGVGSALVNHLVNHATEYGLSTLKLRCLVKNYNFYESLGFLKDGSSYLDNNHKYYNMKLNLTYGKGSII